MDENLRTVTDANIKRFIERLYVETDIDKRRLFQTLLFGELRAYPTRQARQKALQPFLHDWEGRIPKYRALLEEQKAAGVATDEVQMLLGNLLDLQQLLDGLFNVELKS